MSLFNEELGFRPAAGLGEFPCALKEGLSHQGIGRLVGFDELDAFEGASFEAFDYSQESSQVVAMRGQLQSFLKVVAGFRQAA